MALEDYEPTQGLANQLFEDGQMENGEICAICKQGFVERYDRALACEDCGGDGVLATYENQHQGY